jgi:hypothetical protein
MARERSDDSSNLAATEATTPSKKEAVKQALASGITSPMEIAAHLKSAYGLNITTNYVSVIKGELGKTKKRKGKKPGRKPKAEKLPVNQPVAKPVPVAKESGLTAHDLRLLAELASKAGGFARLREFVDVLGDVQ